MTETAAHHHTVQTPEEVTFDLLDRLPITGPGLVAVIVLAILALVGAIGLIILAMSGPQPYTNFGYAAASDSVEHFLPQFDERWSDLERGDAIVERRSRI